jgi:aquaporin Z
MAKRMRSTVRGPVAIFDRKYFAEFAGTLALVFVGCASIALGGLSPASPGGALLIGSAFGLTIAAVVYSIGAASGAHLNPAVTVAMWVARRMDAPDAIGYIVAQLLGALVGAALIFLILSVRTQTGPVTNLGQTTVGAAYGINAAIITEFLATLLFVLVILGVTASRTGTALAGIIVGFTLIALHLAFITVSGASVNPARSLGPAVFVGGTALNQLWLYLIVPTIAGAVAGLLERLKVFGD